MSPSHIQKLLLPGLLIVLLAFAATGCETAGVDDQPDTAGTAVQATATQPDPDATTSSDEATAAPADTPTPGGEYIYDLAGVESIDILILESFPVQVNVVVRGALRDGCTEIDQETIERVDNTFNVELTTRRPAGAFCTQAVVPYEHTISLPVQGLPAGEYTVNVNGVTGTFTLDVDNVLPETQGETIAPAAATDVSYYGIQFSFDPALASGVTAQWVPASRVVEGGPNWATEPQHFRFTFEDYVLGERFHVPTLYVYPRDAFLAMNDAAREQIERLDRVLEQGPEAVQDALPVLPLFNAAQVMHANAERISFQNGAGVRFVTQFSQYQARINNRELFYTFQGMTDDGAYYVAAILPVSHPGLPEAPAAGAGEPLTGTQPYDTYLNEVVRQLKESRAESFTPDLALLDQLIQSLRVEPQEVPEQEQRVSMARQDLVARLGVEPSAITLEGATPLETPAGTYSVTLQVDGTAYTYHVDAEEALLVSDPLAPTPTP